MALDAAPDAATDALDIAAPPTVTATRVTADQILASVGDAAAADGAAAEGAAEGAAEAADRPLELFGAAPSLVVLVGTIEAMDAGDGDQVTLDVSTRDWGRDSEGTSAAKVILDLDTPGASDLLFDLDVGKVVRVMGKLRPTYPGVALVTIGLALVDDLDEVPYHHLAATLRGLQHARL